MQTAFQLTTLLVMIGAGLRFVEASRRHLVCVRFERELHRAADGEGQRL